MTIDEYQRQAYEFAIYPVYAQSLYPILGLVGEVGELVTKFTAALWPYGEPTPEAEVPYHEALLSMTAIGQRCEVLKKQIRGGTAGLTEADQARLESLILDLSWSGVPTELGNEAGDVMWYLSALIRDLGVKFEDVLKDNLAKLMARQVIGAIHNHQPDSQDHK
jgi:NTP pyrophosphatase (non-canonical NTP hydrolase)